MPFRFFLPPVLNDNGQQALAKSIATLAGYAEKLRDRIDTTLFAAMEAE